MLHQKTCAKQKKMMEEKKSPDTIPDNITKLETTADDRV